MKFENLKINAFDERRDLLIPGDERATLDVCIRHFIATAKNAIADHGFFSVALAGGSTPKALYQHITESPYREQIEWEKVFLFFGDERSVPADSDESNYKMAMDAGFSRVPIPKEQIFRMQAEEDIEENALKYESQIKKKLGNHLFDLVILGMGEDGHTASLFPQTEALHAGSRLCVANYVPQKNTWRMTLTFNAINSSQNIVIYVIGSKKKHTLVEVLQSDQDVQRYPIQNIGSKEHKALWIADEAASSELSY